MSDPYRAAPAPRFHVVNVGVVDLAEIVEMWQCTNGLGYKGWRVRFKSHGEVSIFTESVGRPVFAALVAYRKEHP